MKWIGLTGGIATGKSTVSGFLREAGVPVVCADELAREVVEAGTEGNREVVQVFGPDVLLPDGSLNRKIIGERVFTSPAKLRALEAIIHPRVRSLQQERRRQLEAQGHAIGFYDVPLLFEKNLEGDFDATVAVLCDPNLQLQRLRARDHLSNEAAEARIRAQLPLAEKAARANYVIQNNTTLDDLRAAMQGILRKIQP